MENNTAPDQRRTLGIVTLVFLGFAFAPALVLGAWVIALVAVANATYTY